MDHNPSPSQPTVDSEAPTKRERRLNLSTAQVIGGALAASTAAAVGSRLGLAGTITGAALISIISAVAGALYTHSIDRTRHSVKQVVVVVKGKGGRPAEDEAGQSEDAAGSAEAARPPARRRLRVAAMAVGAAVIFGIALLAVTGFELATGRPLSGGGDGTSLSQLLDGRSDVGSETDREAPSSSPGTESTSPPTSSQQSSSSPSSTSSSPSSTAPPSSSATSSSSSAPSSSSTVPSSAVPTSAEPTTPVELPGDPAAE